jgi:hypothetical protein
MSDTELLVKEVQALPPDCLEEVFNFVGYLRQKYAHIQYVQKKLTEAEAQAAKPDAVWISEEDFWREDEAE